MYTVPLTPAAETSGPALLGNKGYQLTKLLSIHAPVQPDFGCDAGKALVTGKCHELSDIFFEGFAGIVVGDIREHLLCHVQKGFQISHRYRLS